MRGRWGRGFAIALALATPAEASDPALLAAASVPRHLEEWPEANAAIREGAREALGNETFAVLVSEVQAAFAARRLLERVAPRLTAFETSSLQDGYTASGAAGILGDPRGLPSAALRDFPDFASRVARGETPPARLRLVARLDESTGFGRDAWHVTRAWGAAFEHGARALGCDGSVDWRAPLPPDPGLAEAFRERVHVELLFLTRKLETPELRRAVRFLESAPAREFQRALGEATRTALEAARDALARKLVPLAREACTASVDP